MPAAVAIPIASGMTSAEASNPISYCGAQRQAPRYKSGVMAKYAALVSSASKGAVTTGSRLADQLGTSAARK